MTSSDGHDCELKKKEKTLKFITFRVLKTKCSKRINLFKARY